MPVREDTWKSEDVSESICSQHLHLGGHLLKHASNQGPAAQNTSTLASRLLTHIAYLMLPLADYR